MPFDFSELFTAGVREILPRLQDRRLAFAFDCRGPQLTLPGDPVAMRCGLHRLLAGLSDLIEVGFLVFDAETGVTPAGEARARVRLAGTGLPAGPAQVSAVLERLGLVELEPAPDDPPGTRRAAGHCPRTGAPIDFVGLGADGLLLRADWVDARGERWELTRPADAQQAPAWLIDENAVGARSLARRLARLGWTTRSFLSVAQARQALLAARDGTRPALVIAAEPPEPDPDAPRALEELARLLPPDTQCLHAVAAGSPVLSSARHAATGFEIRVHPLSPWELHRLTERLCELRHGPWRQALPPPAASEERPRLLVVDENPLTRLLARSLGEGLGYELASVADAQAALRCCERWSPDVVLMDLRLKPRGGLETARRLRELQGEGAIAPCALVALADDDSEATRRACREAGMDGCLAKPLLLPAMAAELERVSAGRGRRGEAARRQADWMATEAADPLAPPAPLAAPDAAPGRGKAASGAGKP